MWINLILALLLCSAAGYIVLSRLLGRKRVSKVSELKRQLQPITELTIEEGKTFRARLKRVSISSLLASGNLPNPLLEIVEDISIGKTKNPFTEYQGEQKKKFFQLLHAMAKESLVSPTYEEIESEVGPLTDEVLIDIWMFNMFGLKQLGRFQRQFRQSAKFGVNRQILGQSAQRLSTGTEPVGEVLHGQPDSDSPGERRGETKE